MLSDPLLVWKVVEGPYAEEDLPPEEIEESFGWFLEVMVSYKSDPDNYGIMPMYFEDFNGCYQFKVHVDRSMEPVELDL